MMDDEGWRMEDVSPEINMRVRHHGVQALNHQVVEMHLVSPEHEEPCLIH